MTDDQLLDDILLSSVKGIGSRTYQNLIERFGSPSAVLNAARHELNGFEFYDRNTINNLLSAKKDFDAKAILQLCRSEKIEIISLRDERYPAPLKTISDPSPLLYVQGKVIPSDAFSIAVLGTRRATSYGLKHTERLTAGLSRCGFAIISGLARGIDTAAHKTALKTGGRTLAVLGCGHLKMYPPENKPLADEIVQSGGAVISEYPPLFSSTSWTFPQRNRIVSGLSLGVLVVEAPLKSGAMISARLAGEQGRDIFAVPGPAQSEMSRGCHQLIRNGAYLADSIEDITSVLGPLTAPVSLFQNEKPLRHTAEISLNEIERLVLKYLKTKPVPLEYIAEQTGLHKQQVLAALSVLENKRIIRRTSDGHLVVV
ncbi:MAG: DNA-processing protein DprA [Planctomycetaceae bacterium]|nr:DNA-processing protein DprA [Planctomycetaceae bacterium]